jgi:hypothetical protein
VLERQTEVGASKVQVLVTGQNSEGGVGAEVDNWTNCLEDFVIAVADTDRHLVQRRIEKSFGLASGDRLWVR